MSSPTEPSVHPDILARMVRDGLLTKEAALRLLAKFSEEAKP